MLRVHAPSVRLLLHILGATVWVGGRIALAAIVIALIAALAALFLGVLLTIG